MTVSLTAAPQVWDGSAVDARAFPSVTILCTTAPSVAYTPAFSPDGTVAYNPRSAIFDNGGGSFTPTSSVSAVGSYGITGGSFIKLTSGTGGVFYIQGGA